MEFNSEDLIKVHFQYGVKIDSFHIGEIVFLKSNPDYPMTVLYSDKDKTIAGKLTLPTVCFMNYTYCPLMQFRDYPVFVCLN